MVESIKKSFQFYGVAVIQILIEPRRFFVELSTHTTLVKSLGFCLICTVFYATASLLTDSYSHSAQKGFVFFSAGVGVVLISAGFSYLILTLAGEEKLDFGQFFSVHGYSSGVVLLVYWMPVFIWVAEPWRWWLLYTGFRKTCRLSTKLSLMVLAATVSAQYASMYCLYQAILR